MANPWEKDKIVKPAQGQVTPAPASENPDRQFYQSGAADDDRVFEPEPLLKRGSTGTDVTNMQQALVDAGVTSIKKVDGAFGVNTEKGVQEFQKMRGLPETGIYDEATSSALFGGTEEPVVEEEVAAEEEPQVEEPEAVTTDTTVFATITKNGTSTTVDETVPLTSGFDSLTLAEGTNIHLDGRGFVTLPHGIVPDANSIKKSDGTPFDPTGSHKLKAGDLSGVDYSEATKFDISRKDYTDDESWAKAVYAEFGDRTATEYGADFVDLTDSAKQAAYDMAWNAGVDSASWSSVQTMLTEASKTDETTKTTDNLIGFTTNFKSGTEEVNGVSVKNYPRGLLKRRLQTYNLVAKPGEEASSVTTTAVITNGARTGTKYDIKKEDGTVLKSWTKPDLNERLGDLEVE